MAGEIILPSRGFTVPEWPDVPHRPPDEIMEQALERMGQAIDREYNRRMAELLREPADWFNAVHAAAGSMPEVTPEQIYRTVQDARVRFGHATDVSGGWGHVVGSWGLSPLTPLVRYLDNWGEPEREPPMTEQEWLESRDPRRMLECYTGTNWVKCCRVVWAQMQHEGCREAVDAAELYADGYWTRKLMADAQYRALAHSIASRTCDDDGRPLAFPVGGSDRKLRLYAVAISDTALAFAGGDFVDPAVQAHLLREIIGNPFKALDLPRVHCPDCAIADQGDMLPGTRDDCRTCGDTGYVCPWSTDTVRRVARGIYEGRLFDQMPMLADALEESGCDDQDVLDHCHQVSGVTIASSRAYGGQVVEVGHVRGCWVLDMILGRS